MPPSKSPPIDPDQINPNTSYTVAQVAGLVGWHPEHLRRLIKQHRVEAYRPSGYEWRILGSELLRMLETREYNGGLLPKADPLQGVPVTYIDVTPEQMDIMEPGWRSKPNRS